MTHSLTILIGISQPTVISKEENFTLSGNITNAPFVSVSDFFLHFEAMFWLFQYYCDSVSKKIS